MTGYFTEPHKYEGIYEAGEELFNGQFVELDGNNKVKKLTAKSDVVMRVFEKTTLFGNPAIRCLVLDGGASGVYMTENEFEIYGDKDYDTSDYSVDADHLVKMGLLERGDKMIFNIDETLYNSLSEGGLVAPTANGTVVAK